MDAKKIQAAARKALIVAEPAYYSWSLEQQEIFRASMGKKAQNRVEILLLQELAGIACSADYAEDILRDLPHSMLDDLNWAKLLTRGIGEDLIFLNESMAENTSLLDFNTLYDYDFQDHLFQERVNAEQFPDYQKRDYYALRFSRWARLIIEDRFHYATLYSLAGYLTSLLEDKGSDLIQHLVPHEYVDGKNHGKPEQGGYLWDFEIQAHGQEQQLEELKHRWYQYTQQRWLELSQSFSQSPPAVFIQDGHQKDERHRNFVFNNEAALKQIRWRHFLTDCEPLQDDFARVAGMEKQEVAKAEQWLQEAHRDIMANFDPKVVKLRKKRKIVIAPGAFDGLLGEDGDGE